MDKMEEKVSLFRSIRFRCIGLVIICVLLSVIMSFSSIVPKFSKEITSQSENSMLQLCVAYEKLVEQKVSSSGGMVESSKFRELLEDVKVFGMSSSYFYLVSPNGRMLYHPEKAKIGKQVENKTIKKVIEKIQAGEVPEPAVVTYMYRGKKKYASYSVGESNHMILVMAADTSEQSDKARKLTIDAIVKQLVICFILMIMGFLISYSITQPIRRLVKILKKASELDFTKDKDMGVLLKRRDEFGIIIRQYGRLQNNLNNVVRQIGSASEDILSGSEELEEVVNGVNEHSQDNSATSQQLAAGMQETAATVETINENINNIETSVNEINKKTILGAKLTDEIKNRADDLTFTTNDAIKKADFIFNSVREKSNEAIEKSKAVQKINVLSSVIMEIADETALLSVNASIEAARAGEMGRGFGVVANEISNLASQSADTVSSIEEIVREVEQAVGNMGGCLETALSFFEENVTKDYGYFKESSVQYNTDASKLQDSMNTIHSEIEELSRVTKQIASAVNGITVTVNEATVGVTDIAGKTTDVVGLVSETVKKIDINKQYSQDLHNVINDFKI